MSPKKRFASYPMTAPPPEVLEALKAKCHACKKEVYVRGGEKLVPYNSDEPAKAAVVLRDAEPLHQQHILCEICARAAQAVAMQGRAVNLAVLGRAKQFFYTVALGERRLRDYLRQLDALEACCRSGHRHNPNVDHRYELFNGPVLSLGREAVIDPDRRSFSIRVIYEKLIGRYAQSAAELGGVTLH